MKIRKAIILFVIGFILVLLALPMAWGVSIGLGYVLNLVAIILGAYIIGRSEGRGPLALGIILLVIAIPVLFVIIAVHMGLWVLKETVEEIVSPTQTTITVTSTGATPFTRTTTTIKPTAPTTVTKTKTVTRTVTETTPTIKAIGESVEVKDWRITITGVRETTYIVSDNSYYRAKEGYKVILVSMKVENVGKSTRRPFLYSFVLVTNARRSYGEASLIDLELVWFWEVTQEVVSKAVTFKRLDTFAPVAPGTFIEGDVLFQIPANEELKELRFKVDIFGPEVVVELVQGSQ